MNLGKVVSVVKMGRCSDGFQRDHGLIRHAMIKDLYCYGSHGRALCGSRPGRRSVGFVNDSGNKDITCKRCAKIAVNYEVVEAEDELANQ